MSYPAAIYSTTFPVEPQEHLFVQAYALYDTACAFMPNYTYDWRFSQPESLVNAMTLAISAVSRMPEDVVVHFEYKRTATSVVLVIQWHDGKLIRDTVCMYLEPRLEGDILYHFGDHYTICDGARCHAENNLSFNGPGVQQDNNAVEAIGEERNKLSEVICGRV